VRTGLKILGHGRSADSAGFEIGFVENSLLNVFFQRWIPLIPRLSYGVLDKKMRERLKAENKIMIIDFVGNSAFIAIPPSRLIATFELPRVGFEGVDLVPHRLDRTLDKSL